MTLQEIFALWSKAGQGNNQLPPNTPIADVMNGTQTEEVTDEASTVRPRMLGTAPPPPLNSLPHINVTGAPINDPQPAAAPPTAIAQATAAGAPNANGDQSVTYPPLDNSSLTPAERAQYLRQYGREPSETPRGAEKTQADQGPGILSKVGGYLNSQFRFTDPDFLGRLGNGLAVAGSQDPFKALMMLKQQQAEAEKNRLARIKAMNGETKPLGTDGVMQVFGPDGRVIQTYIDPVAAASAKQSREGKMVDRLDAIMAQARATEGVRRNTEVFDNTVKEAGGMTSKPEFSAEVTRSIGKIDNIIAKIPDINTVDVPGVGPVQNPLAASIIDNTYGRAVGSDDYKTRRELAGYYAKDVLEDVKKLGANPSNADREFLAKPIPKQDDPVAYQLQYAKEMRMRLQESEERRVGAAQRRDSLVSGPSGRSQAAPPSTPAPQRNAEIEAKLKAAGKAYDPTAYDYRTLPNGEVQSRKK